MKICMVGLGSIGVRHAANLDYALTQRGIPHQIDALRNTSCAIPHQVSSLLTNVYRDVDDIECNYDVVFITNPTNMHYSTVGQMIGNTKHMFIEKPVFDRLDYDLSAVQWKSDSIYYVACPLRYSGVVQYLKNFVQGKKIYSARTICSSYLPDWRPNTDYRACYSAKAEMGGGVRIDLIHEWDYIRYLFGTPAEVSEMHGQYSDLEITSEDIAVYIGKYPDKLVSLHLDYFGRRKRREIEIFLEDDVIAGDIQNNEIRFLTSKTEIPLPQTRNEMQLAEINCFLDMLEGKADNHNPVNGALETMKIALGAKRT